MGQILLFIIALVIIIVVFTLLVPRKEAGKHGTSTGEEFVGICKSAVETASQKEGRKQKKKPLNDVIRLLKIQADFAFLSLHLLI